MTIRELVMKKFYLGIGALFACFLCVGIIGIPLIVREKEPALFIFMILPFMAGILFLNVGIRCPKCNGNLGITVVPGFIVPYAKQKPRYCPFCSVSLDEKCLQEQEKKQA